MAQRDPTRAFGSQSSATFRYTVYHSSFGQFSATEAWTPAVNVYQLDSRLEVCVDLAGVDRKQIEVRVEPGRLLVKGVRQTPEPRDRGELPMRILEMEIDYGPFRREIPIPERVDLDRVHSRYTDGLLWVTLPLREAAGPG